MKLAGDIVGAKGVAKRDYYELLRIPPIFSKHELHKAYRSASLRYHPDKPGGSQDLFEEAAEAYAVLGDYRKRKAYDEGEDIPKYGLEGNHHSMALKDEVTRFYFPEIEGYRPFGSPYDNQEDRRRRRQEVLREEKQLHAKRIDRLAKESRAPSDNWDSEL